MEFKGLYNDIQKILNTTDSVKEMLKYKNKLMKVALKKLMS